jgi:hypothetical protein
MQLLFDGDLGLPSPIVLSSGGHFFERLCEGDNQLPLTKFRAVRCCDSELNACGTFTLTSLSSSVHMGRVWNWCDVEDVDVSGDNPVIRMFPGTSFARQLAIMLKISFIRKIRAPTVYIEVALPFMFFVFVCFLDRKSVV